MALATPSVNLPSAFLLPAPWNLSSAPTELRGVADVVMNYHFSSLHGCVWSYAALHAVLCARLCTSDTMWDLAFIQPTTFGMYFLANWSPDSARTPAI